MPNPVYPSELLDNHGSADQFIANGGYVLYISEPTEETLLPYVQLLSNNKTFNESMMLHAFNESAKTDKYPTPELYIAFNADNTVGAVLFFYSVEINGIQCNWVDSWGSLTEGAGSLIMFYVINRTGQLGYGVGGNTTTVNSILEDQKNFVFKDPATKWILMQNNELIGLGKAQEPYVMQTENFSKVYPNFPNSDNPAKYNFNTNTWIDVVKNPQTDCGAPPIFTPNTFYKFNTTTRTWVLNA